RTTFAQRRNVAGNINGPDLRRSVFHSFWLKFRAKQRYAFRKDQKAEINFRRGLSLNSIRISVNISTQNKAPEITHTKHLPPLPKPELYRLFCPGSPAFLR